jgi:hypothetical protein
LLSSVSGNYIAPRPWRSQTEQYCRICRVGRLATANRTDRPAGIRSSHRRLSPARQSRTSVKAPSATAAATKHCEKYFILRFSILASPMSNCRAIKQGREIRGTSRTNCQKITLIHCQVFMNNSTGTGRGRRIQGFVADDASDDRRRAAGALRARGRSYRNVRWRACARRRCRRP